MIDARAECASYETDGGYVVMLARGKPTQFHLFPENLLPPQKWKLSDVKGVKHREGPDGTLIVDIQTDEDLNYYRAEKRMPAEPLTGYRVTAEVRTEGLEKSQGAQIQVGDGRGWVVTWSAALSEEVKSDGWTKVSADYITLRDTKDIVILARRLGGIGSKGKIFVRNVQVQRFIPPNLGAVPYLSVVASKSKGGKEVFVAVINKHLEGATDTRIEGVRAKAARAWTLTGASVDATNEQDPNNVRVKKLPIVVDKSVVRISLPPHSLTVVAIER